MELNNYYTTMTNMNHNFSYPITTEDVQSELRFKNARMVLNSNKYQCIINPDNHEIVGVRKSEYHDHPEQHNYHNPTGVLTNTEGLTVLKKLYKELFGDDGVEILCYPDKEPDNWCLALVGNPAVDFNVWLWRYLQSFKHPFTYDDPDEENYKPKSSAKNNESTFSESFIHELRMVIQARSALNNSLIFSDVQDTEHRTALSDYTIVLAMQNGYDMDDKMRFHLLVRKKAVQRAFTFSQHTDINNEEFLTLDSFTVVVKRNSAFYKNPIGKNTNAIWELITESSNNIISSFNGALVTFAKMMIGFDIIVEQRESLIALTLDIHNINRNISRLANDLSHAHDVRKFILRTDEYFRRFKVHYLSHLVSQLFQSVSYEINITNVFRDKINEMLTNKRAYKTLHTFLYDMVSKKYKNYEVHRAEQIASYYDTCAVLQIKP